MLTKREFLARVCGGAAAIAVVPVPEPREIEPLTEQPKPYGHIYRGWHIHFSGWLPTAYTDSICASFTAWKKGGEKGLCVALPGMVGQTYYPRAYFNMTVPADRSCVTGRTTDDEKRAIEEEGLYWLLKMVEECEANSGRVVPPMTSYGFFPRDWDAFQRATWYRDED